MWNWKTFWNDENGLVLSSEIVLLGTMGVVGATVGLNKLSTAVNEEMTEMAYAIRSLDQSYSYNGFCGRGGWVAGSSYRQQDVEISLKELCAIEAHDAENVKKSAAEDAESAEEGAQPEQAPVRAPSDKAIQRKTPKDVEGLNPKDEVPPPAEAEKTL